MYSIRTYNPAGIEEARDKCYLCGRSNDDLLKLFDSEQIQQSISRTLQVRKEGLQKELKRQNLNPEKLSKMKDDLKGIEAFNIDNFKIESIKFYHHDITLYFDTLGNQVRMLLDTDPPFNNHKFYSMEDWEEGVPKNVAKEVPSENIISVYFQYYLCYICEDLYGELDKR